MARCKSKDGSARAVPPACHARIWSHLVRALAPQEVRHCARIRSYQHNRLPLYGDMYGRKYDPWEAYGQSKLANVLFTYEAVRRLGPGSAVTVNALHPGVVKTELGRWGCVG